MAETSSSVRTPDIKSVHDQGKKMTRVFRISKGPDVGDVVDSIEALAADGRSLDPFPGTNVPARAWGEVIHHKDGHLVVDPIRWES
jgi:hypothetical protein